MQKIIQLSDTHLFATQDATHYGINPYQRLSGIVHHIQQHHRDCDVIVVTGDLSQDETNESYQQLVDFLTPSGTPFFWLCGNHDVEATMQAVCPQAMEKRIEVGCWQLLLLNSKTPGAVYGTLSNKELSWLESQLRKYPQSTIIALHHPPYETGSEWIDKSNLHNTFDFQRVIRPYNHVKAVIHGHIHQQYKTELMGIIPCFSTPSTSAQFMPGSETFKIDSTRLPGYRVLTLMDDGQLDTAVIRVDSFQE